MPAKDPYAAGMFTKNPYAKKTAIKARLVVVLDGRFEDRELHLMKPISRCVCKNEIHELILTDALDSGPGAIVNPIAYLGFMEIEEGGVVVAGDAVHIGGREIGAIAGFDETHMPNHLNIVLKNATRVTGLEAGLELGDAVSIAKG